MAFFKWCGFLIDRRSPTLSVLHDLLSIMAGVALSQEGFDVALLLFSRHTLCIDEVAKQKLLREVGVRQAYHASKPVDLGDDCSCEVGVGILQDA